MRSTDASDRPLLPSIYLSLSAVRPSRRPLSRAQTNARQRSNFDTRPELADSRLSTQAGNYRCSVRPDSVQNASGSVMPAIEQHSAARRCAR